MKTVRLKMMGGAGKSTTARALTTTALSTYVLNVKGKPVRESDLTRWAT
jgi:hypothetical protein